MDLAGRTALLTGAGGGLGAYIARALASESVNLVLTDLPEVPLDDLVAELRQRGVAVEAVDADLGDRDDVEGLIDRAEGALGPIEVLVNNAGLELAGAFLDRSPSELDGLIRVNLIAPMLLTRTALPRMLERGHGHVVNIASLAGKISSANLAAYCASKHGVVGFTNALRAEHGDEPVGFSAICPGFISRVGMFGRISGDLSELPPGLRTLPPERVGEAVVKAIREDRAEVIVNPPPSRPLILLGALAPNALARMGRSSRLRAFTEDFLRAKERAPATAGEKRAAEQAPD